MEPSVLQSTPLALSLLLLPSLAIAAETICFGATNIFNLYRELQCEPRTSKEFRCPQSFDCSKFTNRDHGQCFDSGKSYEIGSSMEGEHGCLTKCRCTEGPIFGYKKNISSVFECDTVDCPVSSPGVSPYFQDPTQCCPLKQRPKKSKGKEVSCAYGDKTYEEGEKFRTSDCMDCVCQENWRGRPEKPFCVPANCNLLLQSGAKVNEGCTPVYDEDKPCCPASWRCPDFYDQLSEVYLEIHQLMEPTCRFGNLTVYPTQWINSSDPNEFCRCVTPPMITCTTKLDASSSN